MEHDYENLIPIIHYFVERKDMPTWALHESVIQFTDLTYIISGEATYIVNGKKMLLKQGDMIYIPKGSTRTTYTNPQNPIHCYAFNFDYEYINDDYRPLPFPQKFSIGLDSELLSLYTQCNNVWLEKDEGYMLKARGLFMVILYKLIKLVSNTSLSLYSDPNIEKVKSYIFDNYAQKIYLTDLARLVNLHPVYLSTHFKEVTGHTVTQFINRIRINSAFDLLSTNGYSVTDTAIICGFDDIAYFSKLFKKITGVAPSSILNGKKPPL